MIKSNPILTWEAVKLPYDQKNEPIKGQVRLFSDEKTVQFDFASKKEEDIHKIALENIIGLPKDALESKNPVETMTCLFQKIYPMVSELQDGSISIEFIENCFDGMKISVKLWSRKIPVAQSEISIDEDLTENEEITNDKSESSNSSSSSKVPIVVEIPGKITDFFVNPNDTVEQVSEKIRKEARIESNEEMILLHSMQDQPLTRESTLVNSGITEGAMLILQWKKKSENNSETKSIGFEFNGLENVIQKQFDENAPVYRSVSKGLNLEGRCKNKKCLAGGKLVWVRKGMGEFDIGRLQYTSICPMPNCNEKLKEVHNLGFFDCSYTIDGFQTEPKEVEVLKENQIASNKQFTTFDSNKKNVRWSYLKIMTKPLN